MSWCGIKVRQPDGRSGVISRDYEGFLHRALSISVEGGGADCVQLNANGPDTGSAGWEWYSEGFSGDQKWLPLGDHAAAVTT